MGPISESRLHCVLFLRPSVMSQLPLKLNWQEKSANGSTSIQDHIVVCELLYLVPPGVVYGPPAWPSPGSFEKGIIPRPPGLESAFLTRSPDESYSC